jgi:ubiquinone/menaquinone biosynthesis C-methylase UbiE
MPRICESNSNTNSDTSQLKESQSQSWDSVANGWQKWWVAFEHDAQKVNQRLVELAGIEEGYRILDIATGIGEPAITAAKKVGAKGYVLGIDISTKMLSIAKQRANSMGLESIEFKEANAETINFPASSFNAVLCRWGLMFLPNLAMTLINTYKLLSPGGKIAAAVWSEPTKVPKLYTAIDIVARELGVSTNSQAYGRALSPFILANTALLKDTFVQAGFKEISFEKHNVIFEFASAEDYTDFAMSIIGPIQSMLANEDEKTKQEIRSLVTDEVARKYKTSINTNGKATENSTISMNNESICIVGRK